MNSSSPRDPAWIAHAERVYGVALWLLPPAHRREFGQWMRQAFRDRCREAARGERSAFRVLALELAPDLITSLGREQMDATFGTMRPRQILLLAMLCLTCLGLLFHDVLTPPVLDVVVTVRNRWHGYLETREIEAREATMLRAADRLIANGTAQDLALAAALYHTVVVRKQQPYWAPDLQNESIYHHPVEAATAENTRIATLVDEVMRAKPDAYALILAAESCDEKAGCAPGQVLDRLEAVAPDNGFVWALAFNAAEERSDVPAMHRALHRLAESSYYQAYEGRAVAGMLAAARITGAAKDDVDQIRALARQAGVAQWLGGWRYIPVGAYCARHTYDAIPNGPANRRPLPEIGDDCLGVYQRMSQSSQPTEATFAWRQLRRTTEDAAMRDQADQRIRDLGWLLGARAIGSYTTIDWPGQFANDRDARAWAAAFAAGDGEMGSLQRWFAARGLPVRAPADYRLPYAFAPSK